MQLPEGLGLYWRDNDSVQLGLHPGRSAVLTGLYPREVPLLNLLRNPCTLEDVELWAKSNQVDRDRAKKICGEVKQSGLTLERSDQGAMARAEYAAATRAGTASPGALASIAVDIRGGGLVGGILALALNLYGCGSLQFTAPHPVAESEARWLGLSAFGKPLETVVRPRLRPGRKTTQSVVVSISSRVYPLHLARVCLADDVPYLPIVITESDIQIGPFVTGSPCIECVETARTRRDEKWPLLSAQAGRLPMLEADTASALQTASLTISELIHFAAHAQMEPRLSASILHVPPPPLWPHLEPVEAAQGCGCVL